MNPDEYEEYTAIGGDIVAFKATPELRFVLRSVPTNRPDICEQKRILQQKWVASKYGLELSYESEQWRDVPLSDDR